MFRFGGLSISVHRALGHLAFLPFNVAFEVAHDLQNAIRFLYYAIRFYGGEHPLAIFFRVAPPMGMVTIGLNALKFSSEMPIHSFVATDGRHAPGF